MDKQDDFSLFLAEVGDVKPLKQDDIVQTKSDATDTLAKSLKREALLKETQADKYHLSLECHHWLDPYDPVSYRQDGIQDGVFKNLRMGKYAIENKLNLTQLRVEEARTYLVEQIEKSFKRGMRVILLQHGMGLKSTPKPAKLKSFLNMWLPCMPQVIAFHSAHQSHGGLSACYVLLKKNPEQKLINRERHQKRY